MPTYPSNSYHPFIASELPRLILADIYLFRVFNEADLQCVVYRHFMDWMESNYPPDTSRPRILLNEPSMRTSRGKKRYPDVVMFHGNSPIVAVELKLELDGLAEGPVAADVEKLKRMASSHPSLKNAYLIDVYDDEDKLEFPYENWMKRYFFPVDINVRMAWGSKRRSPRYSTWRHEWERLYRNFYE